MKKVIKSYLPYAAILFALYMLVPLIFVGNSAASQYGAFAYSFIFPAATIVCAVHYSWRNGLDFIFAAISPVLYIPSMVIYNPDNNIIFLIIYLLCGILGSFIGDMVYCDEKKKKEKEKRSSETIAIQMDKEAQEDILIEETEISADEAEDEITETEINETKEVDDLLDMEEISDL